MHRRTSAKDDPMDRFVDVLTFFLSGWHIRPKGVKKPFNPVLGEFFRCTWDFEDGTKAIYVCEQVSHHPPISAYFYASPENNVFITGDLRPKSRFLGNTAASYMQGSTRISFSNRPDDGEYIITFPNMYARGILFGTMYIELGDSGSVRCEKTGISCHLDFKTKGFFSGNFNAIQGKICRRGQAAANEKAWALLTGKWSDTIIMERLDSNPPTAKKTLFQVSKSPIHPKIVPELEKQEQFESRRLWENVAAGLKSKDIDLASDEKLSIEENQRNLLKKRETEKTVWKPRFFEPDGNDWKFIGSSNLPTHPQKSFQHLHELIFSSPTDPIHTSFWVS
ncbi:hypothetical protein HDU97_006104 [Phlyctochytrium planicorne]|nr:hypothetical protein HDU97_006104 [Phlyctochytrium planicorne]